MITQNEKRLIIYLKVLLIINFLLLVFGFVNLFMLGAFTSLTALFILFIITLSALAFISVLMCWYAIADLRRFTLLVKLLAWQLVFSAVIGAYILLWRDTNSAIEMWSLSAKNIIIISLIYNVLNAILVFILMSSAESSRYGLKYFSPLQFKTLEALAEVIIYGEKEILTGEEVSKNVDTYFKTFQAKSKWTMAMVITGLYFSLIKTTFL